MQHRKFQFPIVQLSISFLLIFSIVLSGCSSASNKSADTNQVAQNQTSLPPSYRTTNTATVANSEQMLGGRTIVADEDLRAGSERYAEINENPFLETARAPLSTFSIDVDTASYANVRRFLNDRQKPPLMRFASKN